MYLSHVKIHTKHTKYETVNNLNILFYSSKYGLPHRNTYTKFILIKNVKLSGNTAIMYT